MSKSVFTGKRKRVKNVSPFGSKILCILLLTRRIKDNNLLLNTETDSEFLMSSKLNQDRGKKNT